MQGGGAEWRSHGEGQRASDGTVDQRAQSSAISSLWSHGSGDFTWKWTLCFSSDFQHIEIKKKKMSSGLRVLGRGRVAGGGPCYPHGNDPRQLCVTFLVPSILTAWPCNTVALYYKCPGSITLSQDANIQINRCSDRAPHVYTLLTASVPSSQRWSWGVYYRYNQVY